MPTNYTEIETTEAMIIQNISTEFVRSRIYYELFDPTTNALILW